MAKQIWKPSTLLAPVPAVLVTCGTREKPNVFTAAWCGIINSDPAMTYVSVRPQRYSYGLIRQTGEFAVNLVTASMARACDYCGVRSGRDEDKLAACGLTPLPAAHISAPVLGESPVSLECRVTKVEELGSHHMFMAEILCVDAQEEYLDPSGRLRLDRADLICYAHGTYYRLGEKLGTFGWTVRKKKPARKGARR